MLTTSARRRLRLVDAEAQPFAAVVAVWSTLLGWGSTNGNVRFGGA